MKRLILFLCLSLTIYATPQTRQRKPTPPPAPTEASLDETLKWLKEKISTSAHHKREEYGTSTYKIESINFEGCSVSYRSVWESSFPSDRTIHRQAYDTKAELSALDPATVTVDKAGARVSKFSVLANTYNDEPKFQTRYESTKTGPKEVRDDKTYQVSFIFTDEELAGRVAKALAHAVRLCGQKKEPF